MSVCDNPIAGLTGPQLRQFYLDPNLTSKLKCGNAEKCSIASVFRTVGIQGIALFGHLIVIMEG